VDDGVLAGIVEVEAVGEGGVGEHGIGRRDLDPAPDHGALPGAAEPLGRLDHRTRERLTGGGQAIAERVQREQARAGDHGRGHVVEAEPEDEARESPGGREGGHRQPAGLRPRRRRAGWSP
jgi:hypothetical protein